MSGEEHLEPWKDFVEMPVPPSTGRIFGYLIRNLGGFTPPLGSKTLQRFFNETGDFNIPNETKKEILDALAEWIEQSGLLPAAPIGSKYEEMGGVRGTLEILVTEWEEWRAFAKESRLEVPKEILPSIWEPYLRLATIDAALRIASSLAMSSNPEPHVRVLQCWAESRPGEFLKALMRDAGNITREGFAEELGKGYDKIVDDWLDYDTKPNNASMRRIAVALANRTPGANSSELEADLRRLYLLNNVTKILQEHVSSEFVDQCVLRLKFYAEQTFVSLKAWIDERQDTTAATYLMSFGAKSQYALPFLDRLYQAEQESTWQEDLKMVHGPWHMRVVDATLQAIAAHYKEDRWALRDETLDEFGKHADAIRAYLDQSTLLQDQGRFEDSFPALNRIPDLDPQDAQLHEFVGTVKKDWGALKNNKRLLEEAMQSFWMAVTLDRNRLWSWTGLGHSLVMLGRTADAIGRLESIKEELNNLDSNFLNVLSHAYRAEKRLDDSLAALKESISLSPNDPENLQLAAEVSLLMVKPTQAKRYARDARRLGLPEAEFRKLMEAADHLAKHGSPWE